MLSASTSSFLKFIDITDYDFFTANYFVEFINIEKEKESDFIECKVDNVVFVKNINFWFNKLGLQAIHTNYTDDTESKTYGTKHNDYKELILDHKETITRATL